MSKKRIVSPISIDLGAQNTGVYFAHYPAGSALKDIEKEGKVYRLEKDNYTLLMAERTAARHQRRGFDRRQMVKRLFRLIWCQHFKLPWDNTIQQSIGFLLNRRGFSFLTEEYNAEVLSRFPKEAYTLLPDDLKIQPNENGEYDFASALTEWANEGEDRTKPLLDAIDKEPKRIRRRLAFIGRTKKLKEYCTQRKDGQKIPDEKNADLSRLSKWILEEWVQKDVQGLPPLPSENSIDMVAYLNEEEASTAKKILNSLPDYNSEEKELKECVWNFNTSFDIEKAKFDPPDEPQESANKSEPERYKKERREWLKTHLRHLALALHKINTELTSGGRHRSKYFEEIKEVLKHEEHSHRYLKAFYKKLHSGDFAPLEVTKLTNLIGHLSNLELKPLRKYFNDEKHQKADYWDEARLSKLFDRWILREWRANLEKDKDKQRDYKNWKDAQKDEPATVIDFWLETDPFRTIPPYQDNNNRRPPRCQSLILNPTFLDKHYAEWQNWLEELKKLEPVQDHLDKFEDELSEIKSGKGRAYFSAEAKGELKKDSGRRTPKDLNARLLQFIFDRVKADDPLSLNEIYSHTKKYRQQQSTIQPAIQEKLEEAIQGSGLPDTLKTLRNYQDNAVFEEGSFLHLVCNYYKIRQKARDGRVFIHPEYRGVKGRGSENTGRFDDNNHLLTYCNHKPRQKRYQSFYDVAGVLQVSPEKLKDIIGSQNDDALVEWLKDFRRLPTVCKKSADAQKEHRGTLKARMDIAIQKRDKKDALYKLNKSIEKTAREIGKKLFNEEHEKQKRIFDQKIEKFRSVFSFAQINNIAFAERSGNAKTCAVCSTDNAQRMQLVVSANGKDSHAKAQRLPAIETRLIDGAVMRMARIVGNAIAEDKWQKIEGELQAGKHVRVPIITESNRFEFEPSKEELVRNQRTKPRKGKPLERGGEQALFEEKEKRLKKDGHGICPYTGGSSNNSEIDHIIPRSSQWGTLNDEANLIYASRKGNRAKDKQTYNLADLHNAYKQKQFGATDEAEITQWIEDKIGDGEGELFKFGQYRSFINLDPDQQKAFRHALFLREEHPLRKQVINAIDNRNRTLVNGTQRYFAEVLANSLYKKAKAIGKQHLLSFDYFGVEAQDSSRGEGIYNLRKEFEAVDSEIKKYRKSKGKTQELYSHLIDAQLAFCLTASDHRNEGGLKLNVDDSLPLWPVDRTANTIFHKIRVSPEEMSQTDLKRRKAYEVETHHRRLMNENKPQQVQVSYQIHRDSIISERFFPLIRCHDGEMKKGFHPNNSTSYKESDFEVLQPFLQRGKNTSHNYEVWVVRKRQAQEFLMEVGFRGAHQGEKKAAKLLDALSYQTVKKSIQSVLHQSRPSDETKKRIKEQNLTEDEKKAVLSSIKEPPETVEDALRAWDCFISRDKFKKSGVLLPVFNEWLRLKAELEQAKKSQPLQDFLKNCAVFRNTKKHPHKKVRKVYSLPVVATIGNIRLKRKAWNGSTIIQTVPEESLAKYGYAGKERPHTILNKNSIPKKHYTGMPHEWSLEPLKWIRVPMDKIGEKENIIAAQIINSDADRCRVCLTVSSIQDLSLPQDKSNWKGKIICHDDDSSLKEAQAGDTKGNHHCLSSEWKWFSEPFVLPRDRREVEMKTNSDGVMITFTVRKSTKIKEWLLSNNSPGGGQEAS